jgi:23S rRNA-/tRNA-specific pseudouridylate synthase
VLWYWRSLPAEPRVPFEIEVLHTDEHLVVVDKPHFLPVTPGGSHLQETVLVRLKRRLGPADAARRSTALDPRDRRPAAVQRAARLA